MIEQVRFIVAIDAGWRVRVTCDQEPGWTDERQLEAVDDGDGQRFPRPPRALHAPDDSHAGLDAPGDVADVKALYQSVVARDADGEQLDRFGHYLFDALLGPDLWATMEQKTEALGADLLELALCWPPGDLQLHRLNWELMHSDSGFLAAGSGKLHVAITRLVHADKPLIASQLSVPPRVLFVVGTSLTEEEIRPGAELASLLRQARAGRAMRYRLLERASPKEIRQAIKDFRPEIVHFVCHGGVDPGTGLFYLELQTDEQDGNPRRTGQQLLYDLRVGDAYPTIVVLSACMTAGGPGGVVLAGVHKTAPLAATLVQGGIPIVLGMAGRVADITSRLFARRFGESIIQGEPLVRATAEARQVAFIDGLDPDTSADWALPAVFMATDVRADYVPVAVEESDRLWKQIEGWVDVYNLRSHPVFCGRERLLLRYHQLFESPGEDETQDPGAHRRVLAVFVTSQKPGFGRTRLLQELASQAFRDGHLPLLLTFFAEDEPRELGKLVAAFDHAIAVVREDVLDVKAAETPQLRLITEFPDDAGLNPAVRGELLRARGKLTARAVRLALREDLARLLSDVRENIPFFAASQGQVVVLIDDVDRFGPLVERFFAPDGLLGAMGLGTPSDPVPVVMICSLGGEADAFLQPIAGQQRTFPWLRTERLGAFERTGEDVLAYQSVLLNPWAPWLWEDVSGVPWAFNDHVEDDVRDHWILMFRTVMKGIPEHFNTNQLYVLTKAATRDRFTVDADDDAWLGKVQRGP